MAGLRSTVVLALVGGTAVVVGLSSESAIWLPGMILVVVSPMIWAVREYRKRSSAGQPVGWTRKAVTWYVIEVAIAGVYIVVASILLLFAFSYHGEGARLIAAVSFFGVHYLGAIALLWWSLREWLDGSRRGYWLPLSMLGLTVAVAIAGAVVGRALPGPPGL